MDERIEDIEPISGIRPTRKLAFPDYRRSEGQKYQFTRYQKSKEESTKLANDKGKEQPNSLKSGSGLNTDEITDLKNRIAFDRAMILGE